MFTRRFSLMERVSKGGGLWGKWQRICEGFAATGLLQFIGAHGVVIVGEIIRVIRFVQNRAFDVDSDLRPFAS